MTSRGFDAVLSGLHLKAAGPASNPPSDRTSKAVGGVGTAAPAAHAQTAPTTHGRETRDAPTLLDALTAGAPIAAQAPDARGVTAREGQGVDGLLKRVSGEEAPAETSTLPAPQDPILALVAPGTGPQMMAAPTPLEPEPAAPGAISFTAPAEMAMATTQPASHAAEPVLIFDVSVASRLAPTLPAAQTGASPSDVDRSAGAHIGSVGQPSAAPVPPSNAEAGPDSAGEAIAPHVGTPFGQAPAEKRMSSAGGLSGSKAAVAIPAVAPNETGPQGDRAPSSQLAEPPRQGFEADSRDPRKDEFSSPDVTNPAIAEMPTALSTLSPPVRQVAAALARLAAEPSAPSSAAPVPDASAPRPTLARTLTLQISPAALGTVAVRMHAAGGTLDVQLTASDPQTAGLLVRERDALAASLQDGHTHLHSLVIQDGSGATQPGGQNATQGDTSGTGAQAHRRGGDPAFDGDRQQRREQPPSKPRRGDPPDGDRRNPHVELGGAGRSLLV